MGGENRGEGETQEFPLAWLISYLLYSFPDGDALFVKCSAPCKASLLFSTLLNRHGPGDAARCGFLVSSEEHHRVHSSAFQGPLFSFIFSQNPSGLTSRGQHSRPFPQTQTSPSLLEKTLWTALLQARSFVESCEIMYTETHKRWGLKAGGGL